MENQFFSINDIDLINYKSEVNCDKNHFEKIYDSKQMSNIWDRAVIVYKINDDGWLKILIKASDKIEELNQVDNWDDYFNPIDINLYRYRGRYLKLIMEYSEQNLWFNYMRIYYLVHSFIRYLPDVYQTAEYYSNNSNKDNINEPFNIYSTFFFRFMAVFQNIYLDMDESISKIPEIIDLIKTSRENLNTIANWLNAEEFYYFPDAKKREFLIKCMDLYEKLGTRYALMKALNLLTNQVVGVIEGFMTINRLQFKEVRKIFKYPKFQFVVLLAKSDIDENQKKQILSIVNYFKPAHTKARIIYLQEVLCLNHSTYLGVNSRISAKPHRFDYAVAIGINSILTEKKCNILDYTYLNINSVLSISRIKHIHFEAYYKL